jgi:ferredoxin
MRVKIDGSLCSGHGRCWSLARDVFAADDAGFNGDAGGIIDVPRGHEESALLGIRSCPEIAISIVEES